MNSVGRRLFAPGVVAMIGLMGAVSVAQGCGSDQTPVAPASNADVKVVGPTLKKGKINVGSRREHQKEQAQQKGSAKASE